MGKRVYSDEQTEYVKNLVKDGILVTPATKLMCDFFNVPYNESVGRAFRLIMQKTGVTSNSISVEDTDAFKEAQNKKHDKSKKRFLISWAQSETSVHPDFLSNIEAYAETIDAQILIVAGRYKNPTSLGASKNIEDKEKNVRNSWDESVLPYLDANRHNIHKHLVVLSDVKTQPTASTPLQGLNNITGLESCIVGHPRVQLRSLPVVEGYPSKMILTTGAVTVPNYTDTSIGKKSEFHHQLGCVVVELDKDVFHLRQIVADSKGDFYDLIYCVKAGEVTLSDEPSPAVVFGDLHISEHNPKVVEASFDLARKLKAEKIILHDVINAHSISHHEKRDPFQLLQREEDGSWSLQKELDVAVEWFTTHNDFNYVVVRSNHCEFIDRWLMNEDWRKTNNKKLYLEFANIIANGQAPKGIVPYYLTKHVPNIKVLGIDEKFAIKGWELSIHGHLGVHGSRPSPIQMKNLPVKTITGHTHVAHRTDGHLSVGTLTYLRVGYNKGSSGWSNTNVVIYPNGKASHIHIINNKYTTLF